MEYRDFGRTGLKVSALSMGCMRFADDESANKAVKRAVELGINYFDVAPGYGNGTAEPRLGLGLKGLDLENLIVTAKSSPGDSGEGVGHNHSPESGFGIITAEYARAEIERSMKIIGVDHLQAYHLWAVHHERIFEEAMKPGGFLDGVKQAKEDGLFDFIGITTHLNSDAAIRCLEAFPFDIITIPYSITDIRMKDAVAYCHKNNIAVVAMNPLGGGRLAKRSPVLDKIAHEYGLESITEAALRWLVGYPGVTTILNGISYAEQAEMSADYVARGPLPKEVGDAVQKRLWELYGNVRHFCTACGYCGECPQGILIPPVLELYTNMLVPSTADDAYDTLVEKIAENPGGYDPGLCVACRICEEKCPNHLPVSELMAAAKDKLEVGK